MLSYFTKVCTLQFVAFDHDCLCKLLLLNLFVCVQLLTFVLDQLMYMISHIKIKTHVARYASSGVSMGGQIEVSCATLMTGFPEWTDWQCPHRQKKWQKMLQNLGTAAYCWLLTPIINLWTITNHNYPVLTNINRLVITAGLRIGKSCESFCSHCFV